MKFLEKIRSLPEKQRKIILWVIVIVLGLIMLTWWVGRIPERIKGLSLPKIEMPKIEIPKIEIPKIKTNAQKATSTQEN
ncbi:MAG: hypothetical protein AAB577_00200 [Patescibacteria group bacterium]